MRTEESRRCRRLCARSKRNFKGSKEKWRQLSLLMIVVGAVSCPAPLLAETPMVIDWSACKQPDPSNGNYAASVQKLINNYLAEARRHGSVHIAVGLNRLYGEIVQQRRDHVRLNYIPISRTRSDHQCALSDANYAKLIAYRDASYYVLCRSEVAIGKDDGERRSKDVVALTYAAIYDWLKNIGVDMRAKSNEPTTPPGGYAYCKRGADAGRTDPFPDAAAIGAFKTRLVVSDSEKRRIGDPAKQ